jgi:hypothetical protein
MQVIQEDEYLIVKDILVFKNKIVNLLITHFSCEFLIIDQTKHIVNNFHF